MKSHKIIPALAAVLVLSLPAWAQQAQQQTQQQSGGAATSVQPISTQSNSDNSQSAVPSARGLFVGYDPQDNNGAAQMQPDDHLLSGVESFSTGVLHSFTTLFDPSLFVTESANNAFTPGQWDTATSVGGGLSLLRDWNHARIWAQYFGAQSFYRPGSQFDGSYHAFNVSQSMTMGRWGLLFRDDLMYTQTANFGDFETGGIAPAAGVGFNNGLQPGLAPLETIATGHAGTINNTTSAQLTYARTRRTTITVGGVYALLKFTSPGYVNTHTENGLLGYNYALSRLNSVAVTYGYNQSGFVGTSASTSSHMLQGSFGRKITGKLAFQVGAGPQIVEPRDTQGVASAARVSWAANAAITYGPRPRGVSYTATYFHGLTSGSGVFLGAESDTVSGAVQIGFQQSWYGSISGGYSSSRTLENAGGKETRYNWFGGASLNRPLGRQLVFSMNYEYQHQGGNGICPVASCGIAPVGQAVSLRMQWHPWPARIE